MIRRILVLFFVFSVFFYTGLSAQAITLPEKNPVFEQTPKTLIPDGLQENPLYFDVTGITLDNSYYLSNATQEKKNAFVQCMTDYAIGIRHDVPAGASEINHALNTCNPEDEHDHYFTPIQWENFLISIGASFGGVGILMGLTDDEKDIRIEKIFPDSPIKEKGIREGDIIRAVRKDKNSPFVSVQGKNIDEAVSMIRGKKGTVVELEIWRDGSRLGLFEIMRMSIDPRMLVQKTYDHDTIGYIQFLGFEQAMFADKIRPAIDSMREKGIRHLIIDLRGNPGGLLEEATQHAGEFIAKEDILMLKTCDADKHCNKYITKRKGYYVDMTVAVLADKNSASASEIVAGILQLHGAKIIGEKTYGKGSAQGLFELPSVAKNWLKVTTTLYYFANGISPDKKGIEPDIKVKNPDSSDKFGTDQDPPLQEALRYFCELRNSKHQHFQVKCKKSF